MRLKSTLVEPPGGWFFQEPATGMTFKDIAFSMLVQRVAVHRRNNNIETKGDLASEIETAICARLSPENQVAHCEMGTAYPKSVHWSMIDRFLKSAVAFVTGDENLVSQAEAERRANICAACPLNTGLHGCAMCRQTLNALREKLTTRRTTQDDKLQACSWCLCDNRVQVHVPLSALRAGKRELPNPPSWCWQHPNHQPEAASQSPEV